MSRRPTLTLAFVQYAPDSAAQVLEQLDPAETAAFLEAIPARVSAAVVARMSAWNAARCIELLMPASAAAILQNLAFHDTAGLLRLIAASRHTQILEQLPERVARRLVRALNYPVGSVGAWIDPDVPDFSADALVADAMRHLRRMDKAVHVFLHSKKDGQFAGALPLAVLLRSDPGTRLAELNPVRIRPLSSRASLASVVSHAGWDGFLLLPVVGRSGALVGGLSRASLRKGLQQGHIAKRAAPGSIPGQLFAALSITCAGLLRLASESVSSHSNHAEEQTHGERSGQGN